MPASEKSARETPYERIWVGQSKARAVLATIHPTAVIIFSVLTFFLALLTDPGLSDILVTLCLVLSMAMAQASVGIFNEVFDWRLDKVAKPWRAIPAGLISPGLASILGSALLCLGLLVSLMISIPTMALLLVGTGMGILYSAGLKRTFFSWIPYVTNYPSFPVWVAVALKRFTPDLLVIYALAFMFTFAIHVCNQMRDYDDDDEYSGVRGFVQYLGKRNSAALFFALDILSPLPFLLTMGSHSSPLLGISVLLLCMMHWLLTVPLARKALNKPSPETFRSLFRRFQISAPVLMISWYWIYLIR
jgi:4-hydroxybenzoate polyprenyltransferase